MSTKWRIGDLMRDPLTQQERWEIYDILGGHRRSGMGIVYVVYDHQLHEPFALKTFQDEIFARDPSTAERFRREATAWVNLDVHQNVTRARFIEQFDGKPYIALEYVSGGDLSQWIGTPGLTEDLPQVLSFAIQFCDGMSHVLSKGIKSHRDIKPQNCLITDNNTLKVTDFGLASVLDDVSVSGESDEGAANPRGPGLHLSQTGKGKGTPFYMAPEQFDDAKHVDVRADIYSFGVMLYEMITGKLPFTGRTWDVLKQQHKTEPPPTFKNSTAELKIIVEKCLAKDANERFGNFDEIRGRLAHLYVRLTRAPPPQAVVGAELDRVGLINKAVSLSRIWRYKEALACCEAAIELDRRDADAWALKGLLLDALKRGEEAVACCDHAITLDPLCEQAFYIKGVACMKLGRADECIASYDRALEINPHKIITWVYKSHALKEFGRLEEALVADERFVELSPRLADAWRNKGITLEGLKRLEEALTCYDKALELNPHFDQAWISKGKILRDLERSEEALECYDLAIKQNPYLADAWSGKGVMLMDLKRDNEALACFNQALRIDRGHQQAWLNKGVLLGTFKLFDEAFACLEEAERLGHPKAAEALTYFRRRHAELKSAELPAGGEEGEEWFRKAVALARVGDWQESIDCFEHALKINPHDVQSWFGEGISLVQLERRKEALECFDRALEINPLMWDVWTSKGLVLNQLGRTREALDCYDNALELNSRDEQLWTYRGEASNHLGLVEEALDCFTNALEINPDSGRALYNKGAVLVNGFQRYQEALFYLERAQQSGFPGAAEAIAELRRALRQKR
jgi:tetratricopeptide (TPR) repeat protein